MVDDFGRRYVEMMPREPAVQQHFAGLTPDPCVDCGTLVHHGLDRYFQRYNPDTGTLAYVEREFFGDNELVGILAEVLYEPVCEDCGDRLLHHPARARLLS